MLDDPFGLFDLQFTGRALDQLLGPLVELGHRRRIEGHRADAGAEWVAAEGHKFGVGGHVQDHDLVALGDEPLGEGERLVSASDEVVVLNVTSYTELVPFSGDPFGAGVGAMALDPTSVAELDERAEQLVERSTGELEVKKTEGVVEHGSPGERICSIAAEHGIELIILGSHERGAFGRFVHGSVSDFVVHHAPCPVLVVRHTNVASTNA